MSEAFALTSARYRVLQRKNAGNYFDRLAELYEYRGVGDGAGNAGLRFDFALAVASDERVRRNDPENF